jgi:hypothetical protein
MGIDQPNGVRMGRPHEGHLSGGIWREVFSDRKRRVFSMVILIWVQITTNMVSMIWGQNRPNACPNLHIIMRRRLLGQMMAVTLRQLASSTSSILIWGSIWGFPYITEISVTKFKIRLISEVLVNSI